jgi:hypothetical protein
MRGAAGDEAISIGEANDGRLLLAGTTRQGRLSAGSQ